MNAVFFNVWALLFVAAVFTLSMVVFAKKKDRIQKAADATFILVFTVAMFILVSALSDLMNLRRTGRLLSFAILSNAYAGIIKLVETIVSGMRRGRT